MTVLDIQSTFGPAFVGQFVSAILLGVTIIQAWMYYWNYRSRDPQTLKVFIAILVGLDIVHTALCFHMFYWYLILNFGNVDSLQFNVWSMNVQGIVAVCYSFSM
ncbi:hypothetical protein BJV78DRAFT_1214764 [Lactifluus subvellereus]|nr:hypothetical protein BJV78DRAFT_1214764 [Lactifluus subvellereus]